MVLAACAAAIAHRKHFFHCYEYNKSFGPTVQFRQTINCCKRVAEVAKLAYDNPIMLHLLYLIYLMVLRSSSSDKATLFSKLPSKNSKNNDIGISLPDFTSRTNLKLNNIPGTPRCSDS